MSPTIDEIIEDLAFIDDWEDRYRYLIELGHEVDGLEKGELIDANKVQGCTSQVWLVCETETGSTDPVLRFRGDSDAHIVKGLVAIVLAMYSGKTASNILALNAETILEQVGLREHLTPQRSNGLNAMLNRIKADASKARES